MNKVNNGDEEVVTGGGDEEEEEEGNFYMNKKSIWNQTNGWMWMDRFG